MSNRTLRQNYDDLKRFRGAIKELSDLTGIDANTIRRHANGEFDNEDTVLLNESSVTLLKGKQKAQLNKMNNILNIIKKRYLI